LKMETLKTKNSDIYVSDQIIEKWKSVMKFTLSN
jgi:hypothetical protein